MAFCSCHAAVICAVRFGPKPGTSTSRDGNRLRAFKVELAAFARRPGYRSRCVTSRPAPRSGTVRARRDPCPGRDGQRAVLQQQTAASLAAVPGTRITVLGSRRTVTVTGVADLPNADSFFPGIGTPTGAGASAPPDNVLLVSPSRFAGLVAGTGIIHQFHVRLD